MKPVAGLLQVQARQVKQHLIGRRAFTRCARRSYIHSKVAATVLTRLRDRPVEPAETPGGMLTPREREILNLTADGLNSLGIAERSGCVCR